MARTADCLDRLRHSRKFRGWLLGPAHHVALVLAVLAALLRPDASGARAQDNIARGASATFSRSPLYHLTTDQDDARQLTDGQTVFATMWRSRQAVGWNDDQRPVGIELDLGATRPVGVVCIRSARGVEQGVFFPERIDLFVSQDREGYAWNGFIAPRPQDGDAKVLSREFCFPDAGREARYVRLQVIPKGSFFFTDEITITTARHQRPPTALLPAQDLHRFVVAQQATARMIGELAPHLEGHPATREFATALRDIANLLGGRRHDIALADIDRLRDDAYRLLARARGARRDGFTIVRSDPWRLASPVSTPAAVPSETPVILPQGGHGAVAFAISHAASEPVTVEIATRIADVTPGTFIIKPLRADFVTRADGTTLADPLWPLENDLLTIPAGRTIQLWLDVAASHDADTAAAATLETTVKARLASGPETYTLRTPVKTYPRPLPSDVPAAVAWGYFDTPLTRGNEREAARDMLAHGIDTAVVPAWHRLPFPRRDASPDKGTIGDYAQYDAIMQALCCHQRYLFFLAFNSDSQLRRFGGTHTFLSDDWKALFVAWIREWVGRLRASGLDESRFAFYPVDEPHPGAEHDALVAVGRLIKAIDPRLKIYTTLHMPGVITDDILSVVDIFQLNGPVDNPETIARLKAHGKTVWSYATLGGGKSGDPATFYRAQAWNAFISGLSGIGFWSYSDMGRSGSVWNDLDDVRPDYAVVYDRPGGLLGSKRWEGWRHGVQDFALLQAAARSARSSEERRYVKELARTGRAQIADEAQLTAIRRKLADMLSAR